MSDLRSPAYWIGHLFTIVATVIGVYCAASVGFQTAIKLEMASADRSTYFVAESMYNELEFNLNNFDKYLDLFEQRKINDRTIAGIKLNDFVMQSARFSDSTFEIEPQLLTEVSNYYFTIGNWIDEYNNSHIQPAKLMLEIKNETAKLKEQKTMERLAAYNKVLARAVEKRGFNVDQPALDM